jgi:predicted XRE-type DNA-binding protein
LKTPNGHRPFSDLKKGWSPERLAANEARKSKLMSEMVSLEQLREGLGISQEELANVMEVQQPAISKLVRRLDMKVSTLRDLIAAMGGELHITATFPDRSVEIGIFHRLAGLSPAAVRVCSQASRRLK